MMKVVTRTLRRGQQVSSHIGLRRSDPGAPAPAGLTRVALALCDAERRAGRVGEPGRRVRVLGGRDRFVIASACPARESRPQQGGRCVLCGANRSPEQGFHRFTAAALRLELLVNPFPIRERSLTIVTEEHLPQDLAGHDAAETTARVDRVVRATAALARQLPDYIVTFSAEGAGNSQAHLHWQAFPQHGSEEDAWPLQIAAREKVGARPRASIVEVGPTDGSYPIPVVRYAGGALAGAAAATIADWMMKARATLNLVSAWEGGQPVLYFAPRTTVFQHGPALEGRIAAFEVGGEFPLTRPDEIERLRTGALGYLELVAHLRSVAPLAWPG